MFQNLLSLLKRPHVKATASDLSNNVTSASPLTQGLQACVEASVVRGDITAIHCDAIVNPTNSFLMPGGGCDWAIHAKAGHNLKSALAKIGHCALTEVVTTPGFNLPCSYILHTVAPVWIGFTENKATEAALMRCYLNIFTTAEKLTLSSIAIPLLGTGVHEIPIDVSARIAKAAFDEYFLRSEIPYDGTIRDVIFVCYSHSDEIVYTSHFISHEDIILSLDKPETLSWKSEASRITLRGNIIAQIVPSYLNKITVQSKYSCMDSVEVSSKGDTFVIESDTSDQLFVYIASSKVNQVIFEGSGRLEIEDTLKESLVLNLNGEIDAFLHGIMENLTITAGGNGTLDASGCICKNLKISQKDFFSISAKATEFVDIKKEGCGDVIVKGSPEHRQCHDEGIGVCLIE
ncbi:macro domain-containing protein [Pseudomonas luteola]